MYIQHGGRAKWEKVCESQTSRLMIKWNSSKVSKTLTNHIATFRIAMIDIVRCCKHTGRSPPTEIEQVLKLLDSIQTTNFLLTAHISMVNTDLTGLGNSFEDTATHLMLADPVE